MNESGAEISISGLENNYKDEAIKKRFEMCDFYHLDEKQEQELRNKISSSGNTIQIWIHSHFEEEIPGYFEDIFEDYQLKRDRLLKQSSTSTLPNLAFIETKINRNEPYSSNKEEKAVKRYKKYYSEIMKQNKIYYIETYNNDPTPLNNNLSDTEETLPDSEIWDGLANKLSSLGVKKIILHGRNFTVKRISIENNLDNLNAEEQKYIQMTPESNFNNQIAYIPGNCLGDTIVHLKTRGFKILSNNLSYPRNIGEIPMLRENEKNLRRV